MTRKILWYDIVPHFKPELGTGGFATAAILNCMVTGKQLDSMGGGGRAMSVEAVEKLDMYRYDAKSRALVETEDMEAILGYIETLDNVPEDIAKIALNMRVDITPR